MQWKIIYIQLKRIEERMRKVNIKIAKEQPGMKMLLLTNRQYEQKIKLIH